MSNLRQGNARQQFYIFCSVNIGILGLIMGAIIASFNLSFAQCIAVALFGSASYALVGIVALAGHKQGKTTLLLSEQVFGLRGNILPNITAWMTFVGWLIINVITSTLIILAILSILGIESNSTITLISALIIVALASSCCLVPNNTLATIEKYLTIIFGLTTLCVILYLVSNIDYKILLQRPSGDFLKDFLPALSFIIAGTGLGWVMAGADYSHNVKETESRTKLFFAVSLGGFIPLSIIFIAGILMTTNMSDLASSANPLELIAKSIPAWAAVPYYIIALGSLLPQCIIGLKSSDINISTILKTKNAKLTITLHAIFMTVMSLIALLTNTDLVGTFITFLSFVGVAVSSWSSIFIYNFIVRDIKDNYKEVAIKSFNADAVIAWLIGIVVGIQFISNSLYDGIFANSAGAQGSLYLLITLTTSGLIYILLHKITSKE